MDKIPDIHKNEFFNIIENIPDGIVITNRRGKIVLVNPQIEKLFGYSQEELLGEEIEILMPERFRLKHKSHRENYNIEQRVRPMGAGLNIVGRRKDRTEIPLDVSLSPWRDGDEVYVISAIRDITARRKTEEELKKNLDSLSRKNRYEEIISAVTRSVHQSINLEQVMDNAVEALSNNIDNTDFVSIYMAEGETAVLKSHRGYPDWVVKKIAKIPKPKGFTWQTLIEGKPRYCSDVKKDTAIGPAGREVGTKSYVSMPIKHRDGTIGCININSKTLDAFDEEEIKLLQIVANQIETAINNAQQAEALMQSEERYRALYDENPSMYFTISEEGNVLSVNRHGIEQLGYTVEELVGNSVLAVIHEEDQASVKEQLNNCFENPGRIFKWELRKVCKDQRVIWVNEIVRCVWDADGNKVALLVCEDITVRRKAELELKNAFSEIEKLKNRLERDNIYLQEEINLEYSHGEIVGESKAIKAVLGEAEKVAITDCTVLITGETGTGKELLARAIHNLSPRKGRAMVKVNCATLPPALVESELFGHEKGSFTGAVSKRAGRFEVADGSTIFLDEIGQLPVELQPKLLKVLQEGEFERVGSSKTLKVDVRVIAATNTNLEKAIEEGRFREDLYFRLNVFPIRVPPLSERKEDVPLLVRAFVKEFGETMGKQIDNIPKGTMEALKNYRWPGNVRELRNVIERAIILAKGSSLHIELPDYIRRSESRADIAKSDSTMRDIEKEHILGVLEMTHWRIRGKGCAAEILGLKPTTLASKMHKLGIVHQSKH